MALISQVEVHIEVDINQEDKTMEDMLQVEPAIMDNLKVEDNIELFNFISIIKLLILSFLKLFF